MSSKQSDYFTEANDWHGKPVKIMIGGDAETACLYGILNTAGVTPADPKAILMDNEAMMPIAEVNLLGPIEILEDETDPVYRAYEYRGEDPVRMVEDLQRNGISPEVTFTTDRDIDGLDVPLDGAADVIPA